MNTDELIRAIDAYRKATKVTEEDVLLQLSFHVVEIRSHLVNVEVALRVLMARAEAEALRTPPNPEGSGIRAGDLL